MNNSTRHWPCLLICCFFVATAADAQSQRSAAPKPLYRDPVYDGAADPVVIWNPQVEQWSMFYTNRRANVPNLAGVTWVHGTPIGIAESSDGGAHWRYVSTAEIEPADPSITEPTYWAPDVVRGGDGKWHMFVTVVPGIYSEWGHPRSIVHYTSTNMRTWHDPQAIELASDRVIDASLLRLSDSSWRMWYNNERDGKSIYFANSPDLVHWTDRGRACGVGDRCEGPKVFRWRDKYWMIVDQWRGLGVFRSEDAAKWESQPNNLLATPGQGADDQVQGQHADVIVNDNRAYIFYFTHPGRRGEHARDDTAEQRRSSIQVAELRVKDGWLTCDRDQPTYINLVAPSQ